ncbi:CGNR zinc finger domain-containing protein [Streptomyces canarius]|uniref:CGNR zinc finger domain-containing protein n=1 Tax=Streptomyces canarius TaxID=285453 RepID=UPI003570B6E1
MRVHRHTRLEALRRRQEGGAVHLHDLDHATLAAAPATPRLARTADGPRRADVPDSGNPAAAALSQLAEDATGLLTGADADLLTECAAQGCAGWFLRSHGARRWCTTRCGTGSGRPGPTRPARPVHPENTYRKANVFRQDV